MKTMVFVEAEREQLGLLAKAERKVLYWLAQRIPTRIGSDHMTATGFIALFLAGLFYYFSHFNPLFLHVVNGCLVMNWLGDSLDGTLARYRKQQRPRYGFYVDHIVDTFGTLFLLSGLALSGYVSARVGFALLIVYYMLSINVYLATYSLGKFQISFGRFSPTELRLLLGIGNLVLLHQPSIRLFGEHYLLYDVGGIVGMVIMSVVLIVSTIRNTIILYCSERI